MRTLRSIPIVFFISIISSCSCAISGRTYQTPKQTTTIPMVKKIMINSEFRLKKDSNNILHYKKNYSNFSYNETTQQYNFQYSFCPFPWEMLFNKREEYSKLISMFGADFKTTEIEFKEKK